MDFIAILIFYKEAEVLNYSLTIEVCILYLTTTEPIWIRLKLLLPNRAPRGMGWDEKSRPMGRTVPACPMGWDCVKKNLSHGTMGWDDPQNFCVPSHPMGRFQTSCVPWDGMTWDGTGWDGTVPSHAEPCCQTNNFTIQAWYNVPGPRYWNFESL
jgi:hypothetical protein